jgi:hypothetical protein
MLDPEMFIRLFGGQQSGDADEVTWVPADGRAVMGSRYEALIGYSVPDLRGMFLRGLNRSERSRVRNDGFEDPWDDREAGSRQGDEWQSHVWYLKHVTGNAGDDPRGKTAIGDVYTKDSDAETRPKNVAVFYYVKIN